MYSSALASVQWWGSGAFIKRLEHGGAIPPWGQDDGPVPSCCWIKTAWPRAV